MSKMRFFQKACWFVSIVCLTEEAHAADLSTLGGAWLGTPMSEVVSVSTWVDDCGPKPKNSVAAGGGFSISVSGDELVFSGARSFRTDRCWDMGPTRVVSHSAVPAQRSWRTRCESSPGDPRKAAMTMTMRAQDDNTLVFSEAATFSSTFGAGTCTATITRSRSFRRVVSEAPSATATASPPVTASVTTAPVPSVTTETPPPRCDSVGDASSIETRPRKKVLRAGERLDIVARVLDSNRCDTQGKVSFRVQGSNAISVDAQGKVSVKADAEPAISTILVESGALKTSIEIEVVSNQKYDELLRAGQGSIALDDPGAAVVQAIAVPSSQPVQSVATPPTKRKQTYALIAVGVGLGTLVLLGLFIAFRKNPVSNQEEESDAEAEPSPNHTPPRADHPGQLRASQSARKLPDVRTDVAMVSIPPKRENAAQENKVKSPGVPFAAPAFVQPTAPVPAVIQSKAPPVVPQAAVANTPSKKRVNQTVLGLASPIEPTEQKICPKCGVRYGKEATFCAEDGTPLASQAKAAKKHCPVCNREYEPDAAFCSVDGSSLAR